MFHRVSAGSYNTATHSTGCGDMQRKLMYCILLAAVFTLAGGAHVQAQVDATRYSPGDTLTLAGDSPPGATLIVHVAGSRGFTYTLTVSADASGRYSLEVAIPVGTPADLYRVRVTHGVETLLETSIIVTSVDQSALIEETLRNVDESSTRLRVYIANQKAMGIQVPSEVTEEYNGADTALAQARSHLDEGRPAAALTQLTQAQMHLRNAYKVITEPAKPTVQPVDAYKRANGELLRLEATVKQLSAYGFPVAGAQGALDAAEFSLNQSLDFYREGDAVAARAAYGEAQRSIGSARVQVQRLTLGVRDRLALRYSEQVIHRLEAIEDTINTYVKSMDTGDRQATLQALTAVRERVEAVKHKVETGELTVAELKAIDLQVTASLQNVMNTRLRDTLERMDKAQAAVNALTQSTELSPSQQAKLEEENRTIEELKKQLPTLTASTTGTTGDTKPSTRTVKPSKEKDEPTNESQSEAPTSVKP